MYDLIIVGSGPAGLSAGVYAQRARLNALLLEKGYVSGGQVMNTYEVDNYLGLPGISGMDMADAFQGHADKMGLPRARGEVKAIRRERKNFVVETEKESYEARAVILAMGARHRKLHIPGEEALAGMGVSYCATCDGAFFKGRCVAVVGGGDVALEDAIFLARGCEKVYVIHRRDEFRGALILQEKLKSLENVEILWDCVVDEILGEGRVQALKIRNVKEGRAWDLAVDGIFIAVGILPNTEGFETLVELDGGKYIKAGEDGITSEPGIFAAGDIRTKPLRQIITAAADGACAVNSVQNYLISC